MGFLVEQLPKPLRSIWPLQYVIAAVGGGGSFRSCFPVIIMNSVPLRSPLRSIGRCDTYRSGGTCFHHCFSMFSFAGVKLWLNCQPGVLSWDLGHYFFGCCLVNSCGGGGGCVGEPFGSVVHQGRSTMPGWYKVCQIGRSEQQVHLQQFVAFGVQGTLLASVLLCPVCSTS